MALGSTTIDSTALRVYLFGAFRLERGKKSFQLPRRKVEALLAYLVLRGGSCTREKLAALFWDDSPDRQARHSLRLALDALRKQIGENSVLAVRETIRINPACARTIHRNPRQ